MRTQTTPRMLAVLLATLGGCAVATDIVRVGPFERDVIALDDGGRLIHASAPSSSWSVVDIAATGVSSAIGNRFATQDESGALHVVYSTDGGALYHATNASGTWVTSWITDRGQLASIRVRLAADNTRRKRAATARTQSALGTA